jgi:hypothetical protein
MAIFEGVVSGASGLLGALGFDWVTGSLGSLVATPITVDIAVPDIYPGGPSFHTGGFTLFIPNESIEHTNMAFALAQEALITIELAVALQTIVDPKGGIRIKDALDPYHYNVVKNALEENEEPVPVPANPGATELDKLGGAITEAGIFSGIAAAAGVMKTLGTGFSFLKLTPQTAKEIVGLPVGQGTFAGVGPNDIQFDVGPSAGGVPIGFPSNRLPLKISASAIQIKTVALGYIVSLFRNSIDTKAQALLLKNVMDDFSVAVSKNAIEKAGGTPPAATIQEGEEGIF